MENLTCTNVVGIFLLGFQNIEDFRIPVFSLFLLVYLLTICENVLIVVLVSTSHHLRSPMYFFLRHLSTCDLVETTTIVPILVSTIIYGGITIPLVGCITQYCFFCVSETFQCLILMVMSFDRYLAICKPLHYSSIMTHAVCVKLILTSWVLSLLLTLLFVYVLATQPFCKNNTINHFFCDFFPLLKLSCSDTSILYMYTTFISAPMVFFPFMFIVLSYIQIVRAILKITSSVGRQKAFSTCSSHLAVVSMFYCTLTGIYIVPNKKQSVTFSKFLSLFYTVVIPFINPIIYSLRNNDMKYSLQKLLINKIYH